MRVPLTELPRGVRAEVASVEDCAPGDPIAERLRALGFVAGEPVQVVAVGPIGADPILVRIGSTRFALRRAEAARIRISAPENV